MPRNRILSSCEALFIGPGTSTATNFSSGNSGANQLLEIQRVQSVSQDFSIAYQDVFEYGQLSRIDSLIVSSPTISVSTSYLITDGSNEQKLGLTIDGITSCISGLLAGTTEPKNLYSLIVPE